MNLKETKYSKYYLVQEMMGTVDTIKKYDSADAAPVAASVEKTGRLMIAGEGSSRIFPAKNAACNAMIWGLDTPVKFEGCIQASSYDLSKYTVLIDSNSGRTKEALMLAKALGNHKEKFALTANPDTPLEEACGKGHVLKCGWEEAVAATKSVVEQALFCEDVIWQIAGKDIKPAMEGLAEKIETALTQKIDPEITEWIRGAHTLYFAGINDGVAEELTLKTNEITRRKSEWLEGTQAVHGPEEVMQQGDVVIVVNPIESEYAKFKEVFANANVKVVAIDTKPTPFDKTIIVPEAGQMQKYVYLCAGWNMLVEVGVADGINLDKPTRARKIGNEM